MAAGLVNTVLRMIQLSCEAKHCIEGVDDILHLVIMLGPLKMVTYSYTVWLYWRTKYCIVLLINFRKGVKDGRQCL